LELEFLTLARLGLKVKVIGKWLRLRLSILTDGLNSMLLLSRHQLRACAKRRAAWRRIPARGARQRDNAVGLTSILDRGQFYSRVTYFHRAST